MIELFKLVTGEEVIGDGKLEGNTNQWHIKNTVKVIFGSNGLAMIPYATFLASGDVSIKRDHVVFHAEVGNDVKNAYNSKFGSGLVLPKPGIKLTE